MHINEKKKKKRWKHVHMAIRKLLRNGLQWFVSPYTALSTLDC